MKTPYLFIRVLITLLLVYSSYPVIAPAQNTSSDHLTPVDLSTPEKCVYLFYEAFRTGDAALLGKVLIEGGSYAAFSPQYTITVPNPVIAGAEVARKTVIKKWGGFGEPIRDDDILIYVMTRKDPKLIMRKPGVSMPDEKFCFLVRKISNQWQIVKVYSGWPAFPGQ